jgi:hypothetical protein
VVQGARANFYKHFVRARARLGALIEAEDFGPPVFVEDYGSHNLILDFRSAIANAEEGERCAD